MLITANTTFNADTFEAKIHSQDDVPSQFIENGITGKELRLVNPELNRGAEDKADGTIYMLAISLGTFIAKQGEEIELTITNGNATGTYYTVMTVMSGYGAEVIHSYHKSTQTKDVFGGVDL